LILPPFPCVTQSDKERIFQPFEKVNTFTPNAGLGLSFACQYAVTLGGSVTLVRSAPNAGSVFKLSLPNPILASSLQMHRIRSKLPKSWSYWLQKGADRYGSESTYCSALQRLGYPSAASLADAVMVVRPMTRSRTQSNGTHLLSHNQILLMLGWEEDYHSKYVDTTGNNRTVYGRLPWTRNRLIATLLQAQKLAARHTAEGQRASTPVEELAGLGLTEEDPQPEVSIKRPALLTAITC